MANDTGNGVRFSRVATCVTDVGCVLWRQVTVVLWVEKVQEICGLSLHHHLGLVRVARAHRVDHLVTPAEWLRLVPKAERQVVTKIIRGKGLRYFRQLKLLKFELECTYNWTPLF